MGHVQVSRIVLAREKLNTCPVSFDTNPTAFHSVRCDHRKHKIYKAYKVQRRWSFSDRISNISNIRNSNYSHNEWQQRKKMKEFTADEQQFVQRQVLRIGSFAYPLSFKWENCDQQTSRKKNYKHLIAYPHTEWLVIKPSARRIFIWKSSFCHVICHRYFLLFFCLHISPLSADSRSYSTPDTSVSFACDRSLACVPGRR